jgi:hypothetical protein
VFSSTVNNVVPLTSDRQKIRDRLASLESGSGIRGTRTALFDSVRKAADSFGVAEEGDVIYAVTDGGNNLSKRKRGDIEADLLSRGIKLFAFSIEPTATVLEEQVGMMDFQALVTTTGGSLVVYSRGLDEKDLLIDKSGKPTMAASVLHPQYQIISQFYRTEIAIATPMKKSQEWKLEITGANARDARVTYPRKLTVCRTSPSSASTFH